MPQTFRFSSLAGYACLMLALILASASICWAGAGAGGKTPSPKNCKALGHITVTCFICETGEFVGVVSVAAEYDAKHNSCLKNDHLARNRCVSAYGMDSSDTGIKYAYKLGSTRWSQTLPERCKH